MNDMVFSHRISFAGSALPPCELPSLVGFAFLASCYAAGLRQGELLPVTIIER